MKEDPSTRNSLRINNYFRFRYIYLVINFWTRLIAPVSVRRTVECKKSIRIDRVVDGRWQKMMFERLFVASRSETNLNYVLSIIISICRWQNSFFHIFLIGTELVLCKFSLRLLLVRNQRVPLLQNFVSLLAIESCVVYVFRQTVDLAPGEMGGTVICVSTS